MKISPVAAGIIAVLVLISGFFAYRHFSAPSLSGDTGEGPLSGPAIPANQAAHLVTLTENGYEPAELSIKEGETVTFTTTAGKPFWPASNPHPMHWIYPEFDPRQPVMPGHTWSFTFEKVGSWKYHDHLAPYFTGTIHVASTTP